MLLGSSIILVINYAHRVINYAPREHLKYRGCIFSHVRPFYERAVSDLGRPMHRSLWVYVAHNSVIEVSHATKNMASGVTHDDCHMTIVIFLWCRPLKVQFTAMLNVLLAW